MILDMTQPKPPMVRVLVVDDNHDAAKTLVILLRAWGLDAHMATNGAEAMALLEQFDHHAVFVDLCMPQVDGFELARRIRELPDGHKHFLVALTAMGDQQYRDLASAVGFNEYMTKPADLKRLRLLLDQFG